MKKKNTVIRKIENQTINNYSIMQAGDETGYGENIKWIIEFIVSFAGLVGIPSLIENMQVMYRSTFIMGFVIPVLFVIAYSLSLGFKKVNLKFLQYVGKKLGNVKIIAREKLYNVLAAGVYIGIVLIYIDLLKNYILKSTKLLHDLEISSYRIRTSNTLIISIAVMSGIIMFSLLIHSLFGNLNWVQAFFNRKFMKLHIAMTILLSVLLIMLLIVNHFWI